MSLFTTLQSELTSALKSQEKQKLETLRFIVSQLKYKQIEVKGELSDEDVISIIRKEVKKLQESCEAFKKGARLDLLKEYEAQIAILSTYLPAELSDEELTAKIKEFISTNENVKANPQAHIGVVVGAFKNVASPGRIVSILKSLAG